MGKKKNRDLSVLNAERETLADILPEFFFFHFCAPFTMPGDFRKKDIKFAYRSWSALCRWLYKDGFISRDDYEELRYSLRDDFQGIKNRMQEVRSGND